MKFLLPLLWAALLGCAGSAQAATKPSCWATSSNNLPFGPVTSLQNNDVQVPVTLTCQYEAPAFVRYCVFMPEGEPIAGLNPRWMLNSNNGSQMQFNVYSDSNLQNIIGPAPSGGGAPLYSGVLRIPSAWVPASITLTLYGRVPLGQDLPVATQNLFESRMPSQIYWALDPSAAPASCSTASNPDFLGITPFYMRATASVRDGCRITSAGDMDFGSTPSTAAAINQTSTITLRCPQGVTWHVGLDAGQNAVGPVRRMRGPPAQFLTYELYKDAARSNVWGSGAPSYATGTGTGELTPISLTVYGRVPSQPTPSAGSYADTIVVTLTF